MFGKLFMTKKGVLLSALVIVIVSSLIGAGVFATFSDTETSSGNVFAAGTLDLKVDGDDDPISAYFEVENTAPGASGSATINIENAGTIDGTASVIIPDESVDNEPGNTPEPEPTPDNGELGANTIITIKDAGGIVLATGTLDELAGEEVSVGSLAAGENTNITVEWNVPLGVGNEIMDDSVSFNMQFDLVQAQPE